MDSRHFAHLWNFEEHFPDLVRRALLLQLAFHVGDHAAGNLAVEDFGVDAGNVGKELRVARADGVEVIA